MRRRRSGVTDSRPYDTILHIDWYEIIKYDTIYYGVWSTCLAEFSKFDVNTRKRSFNTNKKGLYA